MVNSVEKEKGGGNDKPLSQNLLYEMLQLIWAYSWFGHNQIVEDIYDLPITSEICDHGAFYEEKAGLISLWKIMFKTLHSPYVIMCYHFAMVVFLPTLLCENEHLLWH